MGARGVHSGKKVVLIIIDSLRPAALKRCLDDGTVPALEFLCQQGRAAFDCVSVFPTMTPTATASIATGVHPDVHDIPGFVWYHREAKRIINYGATPGAVWKIGLKTVLMDLLCNLNGEHLSKKVKTVHELMEDHGLVSANINFFTFRGLHVFKANLPWWARLLMGPRECREIWGPPVSIVGQIVPPGFRCLGKKMKTPQGIFHKFGVNDEFAGTVTHHLIKQSQPDLTVVYLPDTDGFAHRHRIDKLSPAIGRADRQLQKVLNAYGSWDQALEENVFIIMGDHSQSQVGHASDSIINLPEMLNRFSQLRLGQKHRGDKELAVCPNERMAHIYILNDDSPGTKAQVIETLRTDRRIDQLMWKTQTTEGVVSFHVYEGGSDRQFVFRRQGPVVDDHGGSWTVQGEPEVIDASIEDNRIIYRQYPDALNNIAALMNTHHSGDITLTARLGYEFGGEAAPVHPGRGSHGSFHREDAHVPLIIAGTRDFPANPRVVDVVPFILGCFGLNPTDETGELSCKLT